MVLCAFCHRDDVRVSP